MDPPHVAFFPPAGGFPRAYAAAIAGFDAAMGVPAAGPSLIGALPVGGGNVAFSMNPGTPKSLPACITFSLNMPLVSAGVGFTAAQAASSFFAYVKGQCPGVTAIMFNSNVVLTK